MSQSKISSFFKPFPVNSSSFPSKRARPPVSGDNHLLPSSPPPSPSDEDKFRVTYTRRKLKATADLENADWGERPKQKEHTDSLLSETEPVPRTPTKKRTYAQYHLELGQSDFLLCTCSVCGLRYSRGDEEDEKLHKEFHRNYYHGVQCKGWRNERLVVSLPNDGGRVVVVRDGDPPAHRDKVLEVAKTVERDLNLSDGWLLHSNWKAYLFISGNRIVGFLVAEPITTAFRVVPIPEKIVTRQMDKETEVTTTKMTKSNSILRFGSINFEREVNRKVTLCSKKNNPDIKRDDGVIICDNQAVPAICGIRAIWVVPSKRRQHVATHLLDALRKNFFMGYILEPSQFAFTQTTTVGRLLACSYTGTESFLIYKCGSESLWRLLQRPAISCYFMLQAYETGLKDLSDTEGCSSFGSRALAAKTQDHSYRSMFMTNHRETFLQFPLQDSLHKSEHAVSNLSTQCRNS